MKVAELVENLNQQGVSLWNDRGKLKINSPKGIITSALRQELVQRKTEILTFLAETSFAKNGNSVRKEREISLQTIGRLIGNTGSGYSGSSHLPVIDPQEMAKKLKVTFKPLPHNYKNETICQFRQQLKLKLQECGVQIEPWSKATKQFSYKINIPLTKWHKVITTQVVKTDVSALIDVDVRPNFIGRAKIALAETIYRFYTRFIWKNQPKSVATIAQFISWAEDNVRAIEDPTNTQVIVLTEIDEKFISPHLPYQQKIPLGVNTLVRTFSEIVIGVSPTEMSILNMNLSDSLFSREGLDKFVLQSLVPKIYVPILPLSLSRFELSEYAPTQSIYGAKLVKLGQKVASTGLLPSGFKIDNVVKRKSHRDIVDWMAKGRTGVSYGFLAYAEPPQYVGSVEISAREWENLSPLAGFSSDELRQNELGRRYLKTKVGQQYLFKQIPDIWLVSSRSGANKTNLNLETDVVRIGLQDKLLLQLPEGIDPAVGDIKPSYDLYVMVAMALATALYAPDLIQNGAPMIHFHGYPDPAWFKTNEYYAGVHNPSVPCGTYESGLFNFLGIQSIVQQYGSNIALMSLIEPDHGTNILAADEDYLITRLKTGIDHHQIELGGKYFPSLKQSIASR